MFSCNALDGWSIEVTRHPNRPPLRRIFFEILGWVICCVLFSKPLWDPLVLQSFHIKSVGLGEQSAGHWATMISAVHSIMHGTMNRRPRPGPCAHRLRLLHWDDQVQCERVVQSTSKSINFILEEILQEVTASLKNFRYKRRFCKALLTVNFSTSMTSQNISAFGHSGLPFCLILHSLPYTICHPPSHSKSVA